MLWTHPGAFAAIDTSAGDVKRPNDMKQILFKAVGCRLLCHTGGRIIKHTAFAGAGRAGITAGVCTTLTACTPLEVLSDIRDEIIYQLSPPSHTTGVAPAPTGWNGPSSEEEESEEESYEELGGDVYIGE